MRTVQKTNREYAFIHAPLYLKDCEGRVLRLIASSAVLAWSDVELWRVPMFELVVDLPGVVD